MIGSVRRLVEHMEWADRRALDVVRRSGNEKARQLLAHVLATEGVWLARIRTGDSSGLEIWPDLGLEECERRIAENAASYRRFLESATDADLDEEAAYENSSGTEFRTPVREILMHVSQHGAYHRGQIAREIRASGGEPVNTDFIIFVREHPNSAADPLTS